MVWLVALQLLGFVVAIVIGARRPEGTKDLEIALLRHQVRLLRRRLPHPPRLSRREKLTVADLTARLARLTTRSRWHLSHAVLLVQPERY